jgi:5-methylcytosine-specific restriction endonuclease McrA
VETIVLRTCKNCGKIFKPDARNVKKGRGIFCSRNCFNEYYKKQKPIISKCQVCGKVFIGYNAHVKQGRGKFCSKECYHNFWIQKVLPKILSKRNGSVQLTCQQCGKPFQAIKARLKRYNVKFCSKKCFDDYKREHAQELMGGSKHWNWKGGITTKNRKLRHKWEYKQWRIAVIKRDDYTCRLCGSKVERPVAHHIFDFQTYPELRYDVDNGITLCRACHRKIHINKDAETLKSLARITMFERKK